MPRKCLNCNEEVKKQFPLHQKCSKTHNPSFISGEVLNIATGSCRFEEKNEYCVCRTLADSLHLKKVTPVSVWTSRKRKQDTEMTSLLQYVQPPPNASDPDKRQMCRTILARGGPVDTKKIKKVTVSFDGGSTETINCATRCGHKKKYSSDILDLEPKYKKKFSDLKMRERIRRMEYVSKVVLACVVDRGEQKKDGHLYLRGNNILATAIIDFLDGVKEKLQNELRMNFFHHSNDVTLPVDGDEDGRIEQLDLEKDKLAIAILGQSSRNGYKRLRKAMPSHFKIKNY